MPLNSTNYWGKFNVGYDNPFNQKDQEFTFTPPPSPVFMLVFLNTNNIAALDGTLLESLGN